MSFKLGIAGVAGAAIIIGGLMSVYTVEHESGAFSHALAVSQA